MSPDDFEARVLELWMTTRIPLTRANLVYCTRAPRKRLEKWLDALVKDEVLDVDVGDDGEMTWAVRGAARAPGGPATVAEWDRRGRLAKEVAGAGNALVLAARARDLVRAPAGRGRELPAAQGDKPPKSVAVSGLLSLALGPIGWLYAAPWKTAAPYAAGYGLALAILPTFLLMPLLPILLPVSALMGAAYAWRYNQRGERTPILGPGKPDDD